MIRGKTFILVSFYKMFEHVEKQKYDTVVI